MLNIKTFREDLKHFLSQTGHKILVVIILFLLVQIVVKEYVEAVGENAIPANNSVIDTPFSYLQDKPSIARLLSKLPPSLSKFSTHRTLSDSSVQVCNEECDIIRMSSRFAFRVTGLAFTKTNDEWAIKCYSVGLIDKPCAALSMDEDLLVILLEDLLKTIIVSAQHKKFDDAWSELVSDINKTCNTSTDPDGATVIHNCDKSLKN